MHKLYTFALSGAAWRVRLALHLKKVPVEYAFINLLKGQQHNQTFTKLNPNATVPSLILPDGKILTESMAIMEYLNEVYPNPNLYPGTPVERSRIRAFCEMINSGVHPFQNLRVLDKIGEYKAKKLEWCVYWTTRGMRTFETMLEREKTHGKYCFGDQITAADILLYPQIFSMRVRFKIDTNQFPIITHIFNNLSEHKSFIQTSPPNQPDYSK